MPLAGEHPHHAARTSRGACRHCASTGFHRWTGWRTSPDRTAYRPLVASSPGSGKRPDRSAPGKECRDTRFIERPIQFGTIVATPYHRNTNPILCEQCLVVGDFHPLDLRRIRGRQHCLGQFAQMTPQGIEQLRFHDTAGSANDPGPMDMAVNKGNDDYKPRRARQTIGTAV